jgi:hypothetical protein
MSITSAQAEAVRAQLDRLIASAAFKSSKRCQLLLSRIVEHSLSGDDATPLRERVLGVEVLGRKPHYDTANDPIVRVTAGEIRRRLGQYYGDPAHQGELRIDLPAGHYAVVLAHPHPPASAAGDAVTLANTNAGANGNTNGSANGNANGNATVAEPAEGMSAPSHGVRRPRHPLRIAAGVGLLLLVLLVPLGILTSSSEPSSSKEFWAPLLTATQPVLVCTGAIDISHVAGRMWEAASAPGQPELRPDKESADAAPVRPEGTAFVTVTDALALARVVALFQEHSKPYRIRTDRGTSFADLRASPTVLVGMFNNTWTMRLTSDFPFTPATDAATGTFLIRDRHTPSRGWQPDRPWPDPRVNRDYAFVSRVVDPATGNLVVIVAGITPYGTVAGAELLTSKPRLESALSSLPADWQTKSVQMVIETRILDGEAGPPRIVASRVW